MAVLTEKQQTLTRTVLLTGMSTHRASLAGVMGIHLDGHRPMQEGFVGDHGLQLSKRPLGVASVRFALRACSFLALLAFGTLTDICQVFQSNQTVWVSGHDALGDHMIGVLLQPSLSSANHDKSSCRGTSAFFLKTLSQSRIVVGFGDKRFARIEGLFSSCGAADSQVADSDIHTDYPCMRFGCGRGSLDLQGDEQVELLAWLVVPQFGSSNLSPFLDESQMFLVSGVADNHPSRESQDREMLVRLEAIVLLILVGQSRRNVLWGLVQPFVAFLGQTGEAFFGILLDLRPQGQSSTHPDMPVAWSAMLGIGKPSY